MSISTMTRAQQQQAINRAMDRAHDAARAGSVPVLTETSFDGRAIRETWNVQSRSGRGVYAVSLTHSRNGDDDIIRTQCTCPAAIIGQCCYHRALVRLAHQDAVKSTNEAGVRYRQRAAR